MVLGLGLVVGAVAASVGVIVGRMRRHEPVNCTVYRDGEYWVWRDDDWLIPYTVRRGLDDLCWVVLRCTCTLEGAIGVIEEDKRRRARVRPDPTVTCSAAEHGSWKADVMTPDGWEPEL